MDISKIIREQREAKRLTQLDMADRLQTERSNYARLESRGGKLTIEQLKSIAGALGVGVGELLGEEVKVSQSKEVESSLLRLKYFDNGRLAVHNYFIMEATNFAFAKKKVIVTINKNVSLAIPFIPYEVEYIEDKKDIFDEYIEQNNLLSLIDILKSCGWFDEELLLERWNNHSGKIIPKYWKEELGLNNLQINT